VSDYSFDPLNPVTTTTYTVGEHTMNFTVYDSLGNAHNLIMTMTNISDTQIPLGPIDSISQPGATNAQPARYENNTWAWSVAVDPADTSVRLAPDNMTYNDSVDGNLVRAAHSGLIHFNTNGSLDYVTYVDANANENGATPDLALNPERAPMADDANALDLDIIDDLNRNTVIGFEGATVTAGDQALDVTYTPGTQFDNPFDETQASTPFQLSKLPIVLVYQTVSGVPPITPPNTNTAGTLVVDPVFNNPVTGLSPWGYPGSLAFNDMTINAAGGAPTMMYVQKFDIDWGGVSTITNADFDWLQQNNQDIAQQTALEAPIALDAGAGNPGDGEKDWAIGIGGAQPKVISMGNGDRNGLTADTAGSFQIIGGVNVYIPKFTAGLLSQDGFGQGTLTGVSVDQNGKIIGSFSNNQSNELAQVAIANFQNPGGLNKVGATTFGVSTNSGSPIVGTANSNGRGMVVGGVVEQSNVDLSQELTNMIVAQRGFEASARLITTSDRILDTLINLGR
jgi:flagellar hook protein FlgE